MLDNNHTVDGRVSAELLSFIAEVDTARAALDAYLDDCEVISPERAGLVHARLLRASWRTLALDAKRHIINLERAGPAPLSELYFTEHPHRFGAIERCRKRAEALPRREWPALHTAVAATQARAAALGASELRRQRAGANGADRLYPRCVGGWLGTGSSVGIETWRSRACRSRERAPTARQYRVGDGVICRSTL